MRGKIVNSFDVWVGAQGYKSRLRLKDIDNISLEGIARLRELILKLAVQGKLIAQDPSDEPASVLLEKIGAEKQQLIKDGKIKKSNPLPEIRSNEQLFELPEGWIWTRLQNVTTYIQRGKGPVYSEKGSVKVVSQKCIQWLGFDITKARFVDDSSLSQYQPERFLADKDLLWNSTGTGTVGRVSVFESSNERVVADSHVTVIRPIQLNSYYLRCFLASPWIQSKIEIGKADSLVSGSTNQVELNTSSVIPLAIPLPPLKEQRRIVAKVDELMSLCDDLEQQETNHLKSHQLLVETLLATLTNAADADEFQTAWSRLEQHFDDLFTTEDSIDQLKQTILQLAVMGKLVPQDPNDEPACVLLEKIANEKERLIEEGKLKKQKELPEITEEEIPFDLPKSWKWEKLGVFGVLSGGFAYQSALFLDDGKNQVIRMGNIRPDSLRIDDNPTFISNELAKETLEYKIQVNDILLTMTGTKGKRDFLYSLIIKGEHLRDRNLYLNQRLCITRSININPIYINLAMKDNRLLDLVYEQSTGTANQANIGMVALNNWVLPIPPRNEQDRIVERVDELFALCDRLKEGIGESQKVVNLMAKSIVEQV